MRNGLVSCTLRKRCMVPTKAGKEYTAVPRTKLKRLMFCGFEQGGTVEWCPKRRMIGTEPKSPDTTTT